MVNGILSTAASSCLSLSVSKVNSLLVVWEWKDSAARCLGAVPCEAGVGCPQLNRKVSLTMARGWTRWPLRILPIQITLWVSDNLKLILLVRSDLPRSTPVNGAPANLTHPLIQSLCVWLSCHPPELWSTSTERRVPQEPSPSPPTPQSRSTHWILPQPKSLLSPLVMRDFVLQRLHVPQVSP